MQAFLEKSSNYILLQFNRGVHTIRFTSSLQYQFNSWDVLHACIFKVKLCCSCSKYSKQPTELLVLCPDPVWNGVWARD